MSDKAINQGGGMGDKAGKAERERTAHSIPSSEGFLRSRSTALAGLGEEGRGSR